MKTTMKTATKSKSNSKKKEKEYELCKVCRINHDDGRRHNYFPRHTKALSSLFSRFQTKLSDVRFFVNNPAILMPELASRNRFWCVFCDRDIDEVGSFFASSNAIRHFASEDHFKNLKHFIWKYGGGTERIDSFKFHQDDLVKWEKRCEALKKGAASSAEEASGVLKQVSNDIQPNCAITNSFQKNSFQSVKSSLSHNVMPLQYSTNEDCQVYHSNVSQVANADCRFPSVASSIHLPIQHESSMSKFNDLAAYGGCEHPVFCNQASSLANGHATSSLAYMDKVKASGSSGSMGFQNLTRISARGIEDAEGNVHSGAPPPWLEAAEGVNQSVISPSMKSRKSGKLNPNRVGAAWAEKRKLELELEKRGQITANSSSQDWLPNFGSVWQSGTRKESRKEFEKEKRKFPTEDKPLEGLVKLQPYISKRMKRDSVGGSSERVESTADVIQLQSRVRL